MTHGIVDVGTNSVHLLIGVLTPGKSFRLVQEEHHVTRLGEGGLARGQLTKTAMRRTFVVLQRYARALRCAGVEHIDAVATEAVRCARNGRSFVRAVRVQLGLPLRLLSGRDEARLIHLGVRRVSRFRGPTAIIAIGGGSTQLVAGDDQRIRHAVSLPLGCARLAQRFIRHDPPRPSELAALRARVRRCLAPSVRAAHRVSWRTALGSSAMIGQLVRAAPRPVSRRGHAPSARPSMSRRRLERFVEWLSTSTAAQRKKLPGLDARREACVLTTAVVLLMWMDACDIPMIQCAPGSLREGLVARLHESIVHRR